MSARPARDPSPFRSGLVHSALGAFTLTFVLGSAGSAMHVFGNADAGSPTVRMALFDEAPEDAPQLNPRLPGYQQALGFADAAQSETAPRAAEPDLGVEYQDARPVAVAAISSNKPKGIRINGRTVMPGQTYSQVSQIQVASAAPVETAPSVAADSPLARFARPFENPEGKPTVSIIVGGLGTNPSRTLAAINGLPPEVTLSFVPTTDNLRGWVRRARRAGHEVLIELPMEPYDYGRQRPHPKVMKADLSADENTTRLTSLLGLTSGYVGVMNYMGDKFATDAEAVDPVLATLSEKGVAMFEDGRLRGSKFGESARKSNLAFGKAMSWIDERPGADEISQQLLLLETAALEQGSSLGTGMPFPVTFDILQEWLPTLEGKSIALAPASHYAKQSLGAGQIQQAQLDPQG
ncbi:MAG: divergent polysaccharide deacetylase family protein [Pseudomonadota bacterium]